MLPTLVPKRSAPEHSGAYFKGKIIDKVHFSLRLLRSRPTGRRDMKVDLRRFNRLVRQWIYLFYNKMYPITMQDICAQNMLECPDFFGSTVIDLIESILDCEKGITVNIDEGGWCYIKGEYKTRGAFGLYVPRCVTGLEPLTVKQHVVLQYMLLYIATQRYTRTSANMMPYSKPYPSSGEICLGKQCRVY